MLKTLPHIHAPGFDNSLTGDDPFMKTIPVFRSRAAAARFAALPSGDRLPPDAIFRPTPDVSFPCR